MDLLKKFENVEVKADTSITSVLSGKWKFVIRPSITLNR